jgi:hypothetical protein
MSDHPTIETPDEGEPVSLAAVAWRDRVDELDAVCTSAQTAVCRQARIAIRRKKTYFCENHMLFIVGAVIVLAAVVIIRRMRVPGGVNAARLGWMSEQWLVEHRTSHAP